MSLLRFDAERQSSQRCSAENSAMTGIVSGKLEVMMSAFVWLDYSERERRKMLDVVDLFREHDTRDELGIGSVRDAFADMLFPGTSTIMTRARYFLLVPWAYQSLERRHVRSAEIATRARQAELNLV